MLQHQLCAELRELTSPQWPLVIPLGPAHSDEDLAGLPALPPSLSNEAAALRAGAEQKGDLLNHVSVSPLHKASLLNAVHITQ